VLTAGAAVFRRAQSRDHSLWGEHLPDPTVADIYESLSTDHRQVVDRVAEGYYSFWLGSGISKRRAKTVPAFLRGLLDFLATRLEIEDDGPHRVALIEILKLVGVRVDDDHPLENLSDWSDLDTICNDLSGQYSAALDVDVDGEEPDIEHLAIAMLGVEGAAPILITANWDPLVERAYDLLFGTRDGLLKVEVHPDEFRPPHARTELIKFHGCATFADVNELRYRPLLIARKSQISDWITDQDFRALRERLTGIVRDYPSLIAGLSAQDADIQAVFGLAADMNPWSWPSDAGAVVVATPQLGSDQKQVLKQAYSQAYTPNARDIQADASLGAYPRVVFLALLAHVWRAKLALALDDLGLAPEVRDPLAVGVATWSRTMASAFDAGETIDLLAALTTITRGMTRFRRGKPGSAIYEPISPEPARERPQGQSGRRVDTEVAALSLVAGAMTSGAADRRWEISSAVLDISSLQVKLPSGVERAVQTFADDGALAAATADHELAGPLTVIAYRSPNQQRSPRHSVGRTGHFEAEPFYLDSVIDSGVETLSDLLDALEGYLVL